MNDQISPTDSPRPVVDSRARAWEPFAPFEFGWNTLKREPISILVVFVGGLLANLLSLIGALAELAIRSGGGREAVWLGLAVKIAFVIVNIPISIWITLGIWRYLLKVARGVPARFADLFAGGPFWNFLGATLVYSLVVFVGLIFCVVPGIIAALGLHFCTLLVIDRKLGPIEALSESWRLTNGLKWALLLFFLISIPVNLIGILACCIGVFVTSTLTQIALVWIYLRLTAAQTVVPSNA